MKTKTIIIVFCLGQLITMIGVAFFVSNSISKDISKGIMLIGIILNVLWIIGLLNFLFKKYFK
jgi:hypothetical protein